MRNLLLILMVCLIAGQASIAQTSELLVDENFQDWPATEGILVTSLPSTNTEDCETAPHLSDTLTRLIDYLPEGFEGQLRVQAIKYAVSPYCDAKDYNRNGNPSHEGVTVGFVSLSKVEAETDTIGQFIISEIPQVDSVEFGYSATGDNRGIRLYTSIDGGATWDGPVGGDHQSSLSESGDVFVEPIDLENVMLRFTSGTSGSGGAAVSQHARLHNIRIWGKPAEVPPLVFITTGLVPESERLNIYVAGNLLNVKGPVQSVQIMDLMGRTVTSEQSGDLHQINISNLRSGLYLVRAKSTKGYLQIQKILKQ